MSMRDQAVLKKVDPFSLDMDTDDGSGLLEEFRQLREANARLAMEAEDAPPPHDPVDHPSHYTSGGIEVLDAVEAWGLDGDAYLFNAIKYIARAGKKDPAKYLEDLRKARFYLNRRIERVERGGK